VFKYVAFCVDLFSDKARILKIAS